MEKNKKKILIGSVSGIAAEVLLRLCREAEKR